MRFIVILAFIPMLHGCLFFFPIPTSLFQEGNSCAVEGVKVGWRFNHYDGRTGTVEKVLGRSGRCQDGKIPILVDVKYDEGK